MQPLTLDLDAMLVFDGESRTVLTDRIRTLVTELRLRLDVDELKLWRAKLEAKLAMASAIGAVIGASGAAGIFKVLGILGGHGP